MNAPSCFVDATLIVGKGGLDRIVPEADAQLGKRKEIKVKINRSIIDGRKSEFTRGIAEKLARETGSEIVWVKGRTFVLRR